jgi:hypothetical protein
MNHPTTFWRECSSCKKEINYNVKYYECSVSSCNGLRTGYVFCSVPCWERHLPGARHRDAAAIEKVSPKQESMSSMSQAAAIPASNTASSSVNNQGVRRIIPGATTSASGVISKKVEQEVLVVVSKVKAYIKSQADMNVSDDIMDLLSNRIRFFCDEAIKKAQSDGRKTVLERDLR